jgi:hypothetical protein
VYDIFVVLPVNQEVRKQNKLVRMGNGGSKKKRSSFRNEQRLSVGTQPAVTNTTSTAPTTNPPKESNTSQKDELSSLFDKYQALDSHEGESEKARDYIGVRFFVCKCKLTIREKAS